MSATKDQIDSPRQAVEEVVPNIENNETSKPAELTADERPPADLKLNEKEDKEDYWVIWGQLVNDWSNQYKKNTQYVKELVHKGVPQHFRGIVWQLLTNAQDNPVRDRYSELLRQTSPCEKIIQRDIARTFPEHEFFRDKNGLGQRGLFNVMKAYSNYDSIVGYCQGSAFLVGVLLLNMPEEDVFSVFVRLMEDYRLREMYRPSMAELGLCIYQLECLVQELLPELNRHFQSQNYHCSMYSSSWFLTLFTSALPLTVAFRVIDLFLLEGIEIIFRISVAILMICKEQLLKLDMEGLLKFFQKEVPAKCEIDPDYLIQLAMAIKYDQKKMKKLSKDYSAIKLKEQEELVELRRLRTENRLLRQRIENLESESAELADKLIQGQVCRAQEAEDNYVIKRELSVLSQREEDLKLELEKANERIEQLKVEKKQCSAMLGKESQLVIDSLQEELVAVKLREAESNDEMKQLKERINEMEEINKRLRSSPPDHAVAQLQEELISVKLREAEANLSMKELKQKISDLNKDWQEHLNTVHNPNNLNNGLNGLILNSGSSDNGNSQPNSLDNTSMHSNNANSLNNGLPSSTHSSLSISVSSSPLKVMLGNSFSSKKNSEDRQQLNNEISRLKQDLITAKLREAEATAELKTLRQKVMELETQNQVSLNQIRRQAEEINKIRDLEKSFTEKERQWTNKLIDEQRKFMDLDSRLKEQQMMNRIKDLEQTQLIAELKQKVSSYEVCKEEHVTVEKLRQSGQECDSMDLQNRMAELQLEEMRLEVNRNKLATSHYPNNEITNESA